MRDPQVIAHEIDRARHDLEASLGQLKQLVRYKLDLKLRARQAIGHAIDRGVDQARAAARRVGGTVGRYPAYAALAACVVGALVYTYVHRRS
jgi:hypothetical protein